MPTTAMSAWSTSSSRGSRANVAIPAYRGRSGSSRWPMMSRSVVIAGTSPSVRDRDRRSTATSHRATVSYAGRGIAATRRRTTTMEHRIFGMSFARIYPLYVQKVERKNHSQDEVDEVICWLTGYDDAGLERAIDDGVDLRTFFADAPGMNPNASLITGVICGMRVEEIEDPLMQQIRYMDKLVDEVARGKKMTSILRGS